MVLENKKSKLHNFQASKYFHSQLFLKDITKSLKLLNPKKKL